ncbi:hypothetical protein [Cellulomonas endophytica]|uniref:hypothetical protein n=1 Tax=Cellulomonas endophytica TaxID=2494735 RepID=UPI0010139B2F|nr:hypothetical protein [Cellulomonas endophytica]
MRTPATARTPVRRTSAPLAVAGLAGALVVALAGCSTPDAATVDVAGQAREVALSSPAPAPAAAEALDAPAPAGTVVVLDGPFTDRIELRELRLEEGGHVVAAADVTKDVSELLELELEVAWYDAAGALVTSVRHVVDPEDAEEHHSAAGVIGLPVDVAPPVPVPADASATVAVPVLVNE